MGTTWMVTRIAQSLKDQHGIETLEWILVGMLVTGFVVTAYGGGTLPVALNSVVTAIEATMVLGSAAAS